MKTTNCIMIGIIGLAVSLATADARPSGPRGHGRDRGEGQGFGRHLMAPGQMLRALSPDEREKLKGAAAKAKDDPAVKAAREKVRSGDRKAGLEELRKAFRDAIVKADPTLEETLKKVSPAARGKDEARSPRQRGPQERLGQGPRGSEGACPHCGNPAWRGDQGYGFRRSWGQAPRPPGPGSRGGPAFQFRRGPNQPPQQPMPGFRGPQGFPQQRGWAQPPQGSNPRWAPGGPNRNSPRGYFPPPPQGRAYGRDAQGQSHQNAPPPGGGPRHRYPGRGSPPHRGGNPWQGPDFQ